MECFFVTNSVLPMSTTASIRGSTTGGARRYRVSSPLGRAAAPSQRKSPTRLKRDTWCGQQDGGALPPGSNAPLGGQLFEEDNVRVVIEANGNVGKDEGGTVAVPWKRTGDTTAVPRSRCHPSCRARRENRDGRALTPLRSSGGGDDKSRGSGIDSVYYPDVSQFVQGDD